MIWVPQSLIFSYIRDNIAGSTHGIERKFHKINQFLCFSLMLTESCELLIGFLSHWILKQMWSNLNLWKEIYLTKLILMLNYPSGLQINLIIPRWTIKLESVTYLLLPPQESAWAAENPLLHIRILTTLHMNRNNVILTHNVLQYTSW